MSTTFSNSLGVRPPGDAIKKISFSEAGEISFFNKNSKKPLPPLVEAFFDEDGDIQVDIIVFIASSFPKPDFNIFQLFSISSSGTPKLQSFMDYDLEEVESRDFKAYQASFKATNKHLIDGVTLADIKDVEAFSWNIDPVLSRGTVTMVQSSVAP